MNSNHPITKLGAAIRVLLVKLLLDENHGAIPATFDLRPHETTLTALCREYAASELRRVVGEDEYVSEDLLRNSANDDPSIPDIISEARNELRRTLRVRADELEGK